ncbi:MAG: hypothetical protein IKA31_04300, partial [Clostridia bacterium]|nr:hypothetical protein [Clostridia bacterium]
SGNKAVSGAGIYQDGGELIITGTNVNINANTATSYGGGLCINGENATVKVVGSSIKENTALSGAGLYVANGTVEISDNAKVESNTAITGGGLFVNAGDVTLKGSSLVSKNKATNGAGIYQNGGNLTLKTIVLDTNNENNTEISYGGALYLNGGEISVESNTVIRLNTATYGGGIYVGQANVTIESASVANNNSGYGAIYISEEGLLTLVNVKVESNATLTNSPVEIVNANDKLGIYIENDTANNAFTISNESAISDIIYLTTGTIVNISDAFDKYKGHTAIKIAMEETYEGVQICVGKFADTVNADANKFTADTSLIFVEEGQYIYIVKGIIENLNIAKKYGSVQSAINGAEKDKENVLQIFEDIEIAQTITIPTDKIITFVSKVQSEKAGFKFFRGEDFTDVMFDVKGTLSLNKTDSEISLTVEGLTSVQNKSMFNVSGTLNMNLVTSLINNYADNGGAVTVAGGTFNMVSGEIYGNKASDRGSAIFATSGVVNVTTGTIGKYETGSMLGNKGGKSAVHMLAGDLNIGVAGKTSVLIAGNEGESVIKVDGNVKLRLTNTFVTNNNATVAGIYYHSTASDASVISNSDIVNCGEVGVYASFGKLNINGKLSEAGISKNKVGVKTSGNAEIVVTSTPIKQNTLVGIETTENSRITVIGVTINENKVGAKASGKSKLKFAPTTSTPAVATNITNNTENGIIVEGESSVEMEDGVVSNNGTESSSENKGGLYYNSQSTAESIFAGVSFENNKGVGVKQANGLLTLTIRSTDENDGCVVANNDTGVLVVGGEMTILGCEIKANEGFGLSIDGENSKVTATDLRVVENKGATVSSVSITSDGSLALKGSKTYISNPESKKVLDVAGEFVVEGTVDIKDLVQLANNTYKIFVSGSIVNNDSNNNVINIGLHESHVSEDVVVTYVDGIRPQ